MLFLFTFLEIKGTFPNIYNSKWDREILSENPEKFVPWFLVVAVLWLCEKYSLWWTWFHQVGSIFVAFCLKDDSSLNSEQIFNLYNAIIAKIMKVSDCFYAQRIIIVIVKFMRPRFMPPTLFKRRNLFFWIPIQLANKNKNLAFQILQSCLHFLLPKLS